MAEKYVTLAREGNVFAVHSVAGQLSHGRVTTDESRRLFIHSLQEGQPPPDASQVIQYNEMMKLEDPSSRLTFLDLGTNESLLGRLIIELSPDTKGAQNFAILCSGESGVSYAGTKFFQVNHFSKKWEYVGGGDYEFNNGEGGKGVVGKMDLGPEYERPWVEGAVRGFWGLGDQVAGQFFICTRTHSGGVCSPAFGMVTEGLGVLRDAVKSYQPISEVSVVDCGKILTY